MELFSEDAELSKLEALYAQARIYGNEWVQFLDLCFDGGDSIEEAEALFAQSLEENPSLEVFFS